MLGLRKTFALALGLVIALSLLAGCSGEHKDKKFVIATDTTYAPFEFTDSKGDFVGADLDILAAVAQDQGFQYEIRRLGFDAAVAALESNQADGVIAGMSITDKRKEKYNFSDPYYDKDRIVMAVKAGDGGIKNYADLKGKTVAAKTGTEGARYTESLAPKYHFKIQYFADSPTMYEDVKTGNSAACFEDLPVMAYGISQGNGMQVIDDPSETPPSSSFGFAVLKSNPANQKLLAMFQAGLTNIKKSGKHAEILKKYGLN
ncbi:MAG: transporter substrate-binding domain-containing protein [Burkholderiaceae bacterium]|jgi:polar amino acid transport system substrate-binding protein|nr:transporter substrate-binding domain-containing protein [Burkholderiaceae bacterium]